MQNILNLLIMKHFHHFTCSKSLKSVIWNLIFFYITHVYIIREYKVLTFWASPDKHNFIIFSIYFLVYFINIVIKYFQKLKKKIFCISPGMDILII